MSKRRLNRTGLPVLIALVLGFLGACASVPDPASYEKPASHALTDTQGTRLGQLVREGLGDIADQSAFYPLVDGMDAFVARMAVVAAAERSLDVQYYIWHNDTSGVLLVNELLKAADRGVRVRLLLDDLDTAGKDAFLARFDAHPNIEVRLYNPFGYRGSRGIGFAGDLKRLNHRMHNKSLTADNQVTVVGGRNIGNEYFGAVAHTAFQDLDVMGVGPVVGKVSTMFDRYWNSDVVVPVAAFGLDDGSSDDTLPQARAALEQRAAEYMDSDYVRAIRADGALERLQLSKMTFLRGRATLLYDSPDKVTATEITADTHLAPQLAPLFTEARGEVVIVSPYFVPGEKLVDFFGDLADKGVRVRIITNSLAANDVGLVHAGYMRYREALIRRGVEMYEYKPDPSQITRNKKWIGSSEASLHAKTMGSGHQRVFVGSFNLDPRSIALNTEMGILIENETVATQLHDSFDTMVGRQAYRVELVDGKLRWTDPGTDGQAIIYDTEPHTTWWQRFAAGTLSLIVPESML
ncbi:phospholipase D family protein [Parahaliea aestuarii]|nr:phospholipase D family protein [Parahaliea aestuarii]